MSTSRASSDSQDRLRTALDLLSIAVAELVEHGHFDAVRPILLRLRSEALGNDALGVHGLFRRTELSLSVCLAEARRDHAQVVGLSRLGMRACWPDDPAFYNFCRSRLDAHASLGQVRHFSRVWSLSIHCAIRWGDIRFQGLGLLEYAVGRREVLDLSIVRRALAATSHCLGLPEPALKEHSLDLDQFLSTLIRRLKRM